MKGGNDKKTYDDGRDWHEKISIFDKSERRDGRFLLWGEERGGEVKLNFMVIYNEKVNKNDLNFNFEE